VKHFGYALALTIEVMLLMGVINISTSMFNEPSTLFVVVAVLFSFIAGFLLVWAMTKTVSSWFYMITNS